MTGVMGLLYIDVVREKARKGLRSTINQTYGDHPIPVNFRDTWDHLQANVMKNLDA
jgi:hypothetical protein